MTACTTDTPRPGVSIHQPAKGFRYGAEAFWVVGSALESGRPRRAADLGTGSGIMAWLLAAHGVDVWAIDVRPEWSELWRMSDEASDVVGRVALVCGDVRSHRPEQRVDLVVCNPPFFASGSGPMPTDPWRAAARFECAGSIADFVVAAIDILEPTGRAIFVVPNDRADDVIAATTQPWGVAAMVRVGKRRTLLHLEQGVVSTRREELTEGAERVQTWYRLATGDDVRGVRHG